MKKLLLLATFVLSSCSFVKECTNTCEYPTLSLPDSPKITLDPVKVKVMTKSEVASQDAAVVFVLTESDYKNLALNAQKILSHIQNQNKIIKLYRRYYEDERSLAK